MKCRFQSAMLGLAIFSVPAFPFAQSATAEVHPGAGSNIAASATPAQEPGQLKVLCNGDQLTIAAYGSPLSTILSEIARCSGAHIEDSGAAVRAKFFETIGPAPIQDVLISLLDSSGVNYVIQVSESNPQKIATVLLLARADHGVAGDSLDSSSPSTGRRAFPKQARQNSREGDEPESSNDAGSEAAVADPSSGSSPDAAPLEPPPGAAARIPTVAADSAPVSSEMNLQDRISDMQRMFEQRKQMVQEQKSRQH